MSEGEYFIDPNSGVCHELIDMATPCELALSPNNTVATMPNGLYWLMYPDAAIPVDENPKLRDGACCPTWEHAEAWRHDVHYCFHILMGNEYIGNADRPAFNILHLGGQDVITIGPMGENTNMDKARGVMSALAELADYPEEAEFGKKHCRWYWYRGHPLMSASWRVGEQPNNIEFVNIEGTHEDEAEEEEEEEEHNEDEEQE